MKRSCRKERERERERGVGTKGNRGIEGNTWT